MKTVKNVEMDNLDLKILNILQDDAKLPYAVIGKRMGISPSGVHKRVRRLMDIGVIKKFVATIDPAISGKKLKAFIGISTLPGTCGDVISRLSQKPEVMEIHEVAGEHDLFVKVVVDDTLKLNEILHEMDRIQGVSSTRTLVVLKTEKETGKIQL